MRYTVFLIYIVVMVQFINSKRKTGKSDDTNGNRGYYFYRWSGIINIVLGTAGMVAVSFLLRDNDIIPQAQAFVWIALGGFIFMMFYGAYCIYKMMTSTIA